MHNEEYIRFLGWEGYYARFEIKKGKSLPNGRRLERIIVAHEGDWIGPYGMGCHKEFETYEQVQDSLGEGLSFVQKEYSNLQHQSFFEYILTGAERSILAVPATGEEICFRIYGADSCHRTFLLVEREL